MILSDVLKQCPRAKEKYYQFAAKTLTGLQQFINSNISSEVEREIPVIESEMVQQYAESLFIVNTRCLYDFFDEQEVWVIIDYNHKNWFYRVVEEKDGVFNSRKEAEMSAFIKAFNVLEEKLNNQ